MCMESSNYGKYTVNVILHVTLLFHILICDLEYEKVTSPQINHFEICNKIAKKLKASRIPFCLLNILRDMLPFI